jgi:hypothetical protein
MPGLPFRAAALDELRWLYKRTVLSKWKKGGRARAGEATTPPHPQTLSLSFTSESIINEKKKIGFLFSFFFYC